MRRRDFRQKLEETDFLPDMILMTADVTDPLSMVMEDPIIADRSTYVVLFDDTEIVGGVSFRVSDPESDPDSHEFTARGTATFGVLMDTISAPYRHGEFTVEGITSPLINASRFSLA